MNASQHRVFYYHGDASPLGGHVTHPIESLVHSQGSVSLSQAGGQASARAERFKLDDIISCEAAYSEVFGTVHKVNGNWTTLVTSVVEGFNILEVVTADRIVSRMAVEHPREGYHPKVSFVGSQFENLRIGGKPITPNIDLDLLAVAASETQDVHPVKDSDILGSTADLERIGFPDCAWTEHEGFIRKAVDRNSRITSSKDAPEWLKRRFEWVGSAEERKKKGHVLSSLVHEVQGAKPGSCFGHVIHVPDFGNIFLGELSVTQGSFRLTMLRAEMGCAADGVVSAATTTGNGFPAP
jgi:hypothetical protein